MSKREPQEWAELAEELLRDSIEHCRQVVVPPELMVAIVDGIYLGAVLPAALNRLNKQQRLALALLQRQIRTSRRLWKVERQEWIDEVLATAAAPPDGQESP